MAKKKESVSAQADDIAVTDSVENASSTVSVPSSISSVEEAKKLVESDYELGDRKVAYVTSDKQVFWKENAGSASNHAIRNNLNLYMVTWD